MSNIYNIKTAVLRSVELIKTAVVQMCLRLTTVRAQVYTCNKKGDMFHYRLKAVPTTPSRHEYDVLVTRQRQLGGDVRTMRYLWTKEKLDEHQRLFY